MKKALLLLSLLSAPALAGEGGHAEARREPGLETSTGAL